MDYRNVQGAQLFRGIRNNNPGNISFDPGTTWNGQVGNDGIFVIFSDMQYGLRALGMDLANKMLRDGLTSISDVISVYAPPSENDTAAYIASVSRDTGLAPDEDIPKTLSALHGLIRAIINHEEGAAASQTFVADTDIDQGIQAMPAPLLSSFVNGPTVIDDNPGGFALALVGLIVVGAVIAK